MKFLLDANVPRSLAHDLRHAGHACRHVLDIGMATAGDAVIVAEAKHAVEVILTHDLDYGDLLAFSGDHAPSVVIFRCRSTLPRDLYRALTGCWSVIEQDLRRGAIVIIEDAHARIRSLPIETTA